MSISNSSKRSDSRIVIVGLYCQQKTSERSLHATNTFYSRSAAYVSQYAGLSRPRGQNEAELSRRLVSQKGMNRRADGTSSASLLGYARLNAHHDRHNNDLIPRPRRGGPSLLSTITMSGYDEHLLAAAPAATREQLQVCGPNIMTSSATTQKSHGDYRRVTISTC